MFFPYFAKKQSSPNRVLLWSRTYGTLCIFAPLLTDQFTEKKGYFERSELGTKEEKSNVFIEKISLLLSVEERKDEITGECGSYGIWDMDFFCTGIVAKCRNQAVI
jgi:hypothetical protein